MATNDRNKENASDANERREDAQNRSAEDSSNRESTDADEGVADLDGDGFIGNTGGFYGGTSYLGSNYGEGWNAEGDKNENEGNFGVAGQNDATEDEQEATDKAHLTKDDKII